MPDPQNNHTSKFSAIINQKCPRCRKGPLFVHPALSFKFTKMYENCPVCGLKYEVEPGFFWGAMYISYAFTVTIGIISGIVIYNLLNDPDVIVYLGIIGLILVLLSPFVFRFSRVIMLHLFSAVKYDPKAAENNLNK